MGSIFNSIIAGFKPDVKLKKLTNMKMKKYLFLLVAVASLGLTTGCDDDDDRTVPVPDAVADTFGGMYPNASDVEWTGRNGYLIADFRDGNTDMQAWFTAAETGG